MIEVCICLLLLFTSVHSYPSINTHTDADEFELSNEFLSHHFGSDFKDAVHIQLHPSDMIDTGNTLRKHLPENKNNVNFKRSTFAVHVPQHVQQLLQLDEIEALEKGMKEKSNKSPTLVSSNNFHRVKPPMVTNSPSANYYNTENSFYPHFFHNTQSILPQKQQNSPSYDSKFEYKDSPKLTVEKSMHPSYELISKPSQVQVMKPFLQSPFEKTTHPRSPSALEQLSFKKIPQHLNEQISPPSSKSKILQHPLTSETQPSKGIMSQSLHTLKKPLYNKILFAQEKKHPIRNFPFEKRRFSYEPKPLRDGLNQRTAYEEIQHPFIRGGKHEDQHTSYDPKLLHQKLSRPAVEKPPMQPLHKKTLQDLFEKNMHIPYEQISKPSHEKIIEPTQQQTFEKPAKFSAPFGKISQDLNEKITSSLQNNTLQSPTIETKQPAKELVSQLLHKAKESPKKKERKFSYEPKQSIDSLRKQNNEKIKPSDFTSQPFNSDRPQESFELKQGLSFD